MSLRENLQSLFEPKEVRGAKRIAEMQQALERVRDITAQYARGQICLGQYIQELAEINPLTELSLRRLASEIGGDR